MEPELLNTKFVVQKMAEDEINEKFNQNMSIKSILKKPKSKQKLSKNKSKKSSKLQMVVMDNHTSIKDSFDMDWGSGKPDD